MKITRRTSLTILGIGAAFVLAVAALALFPQPVRAAAACPVTPLKGTFFLFMKGSYLDVQFGKNPDMNKNTNLTDTVAKLVLTPLKPQRFPYSGPNSSNWLFVFDLGCNPPAPLTLTLANKEGKKITVSLELFDGTRYAGVLRGTENKALADLFAKGTQSEVSLSLTDGGNANLWQSGILKVYRARGGGNGRNGEDGDHESESGGSGGGGSGGCTDPDGCGGAS